MSKISVCMIVKNEEKLLARGLDCIKDVADEIIITDTGSTDKTKEIAKKYTKHIHDFEWINSSAAARNYTTQFASNDYLVRWDADFVMNPEMVQKLKRLKEKNFYDKDIIATTLNMDFSEDWTPIKGTIYEFIYRKSHIEWKGRTHEYLVPIDEKYSPKFLYSHGITLDNRKDISKRVRYDQAISNILSELEDEPDNHVLIGYLIDSYLFDNREEEAFDLMQKYLSITEGISPINKGGVISRAVHILQKEKKFDEALKLAYEYEDLAKSNPTYLLVLGDSQLPYDTKKSCKYYDQYLDSEKIGVENLLYFDHERQKVHPNLMLGAIYMGEGKTKLGLEHLETAYSETTSDETREVIDSLRLN